ncbi:hypothetical protein [Parabacteroides sp. FAFU027]|uniref:hypothetical protein n=1 Tax=Parabacteroides sp. FAFU027 TaxID=2922715 RepID=UPI001FAFCE3B|nr:hypothetical protein [Parabacteroides sp. FAFU027]
MANKRNLKKAIHQVTAALFSECIIFKEFIPGVDADKADKALDKILDFQSEYLSRVNKYGGKEDAKLVKAYFKKLTADITTDAQNLFKEINELNK